MRYKTCKRCGEDYISWWNYADSTLTKEHICDPVFVVICDDYDPEAEHEFHAMDYWEAARKFAKEYDKDEGDLINCDSIVVRVKKSNDSKWKHFRLFAEPSVDYRVSEIFTINDEE